MITEDTINNNVVEIQIKGSVSPDEVYRLSDKLIEYRASGHYYVIFNLCDVTDLSSKTMQRLIALRTDAQLAGGELVLTELSAVCEYVLELAELECNWFQKTDDALSRLQVKATRLREMKLVA